MTRSTLAVFEGGGDGWSAFALDFPGTGGLGDTLDETRQSLLEGIGYMLEQSDVCTRFLDNPPCTNIDFSEFDPSHTGHYVIEWLRVDVPASAMQTAQAA